MATMGNYCKAYPISRVQTYPGWKEKPLPPRPQDPHDVAEEEPLDERYVFLQENYVVTADIFLDEDILFDDVTPEWKAFCEETLEFRVPDPEPEPTLIVE